MKQFKPEYRNVSWHHFMQLKDILNMYKIVNLKDACHRELMEFFK